MSFSVSLSLSTGFWFSQYLEGSGALSGELSEKKIMEDKCEIAKDYGTSQVYGVEPAESAILNGEKPGVSTPGLVLSRLAIAGSLPVQHCPAFPQLVLLWFSLP
ncbi:unnamed protein product [Ilex paraguariensis]|uniref:Uncharacterized protein n=1 Tax=Ilex paraguariensis TaxID=185542 RepID=A0ABC8RE99_9AQUA